VAIPSQPKDLQTRAPSKASKFAADLWTRSVGDRIRLLIDPSPETAATFFRAGLESFDVQDLRAFVESDRDVIPLLVEWMALDHEIVRPWAQTVVRIWWPHIFAQAMNPAQMLADIARDDPVKGAVLNTPKGRIWFNSTVFNLITFFRAYAKIEGDGVIQPPPSIPDRLRRRGLRGAARVMEKIQNPK